MYSPSLVAVNEHFDKRRSAAVGIATLGASVGALVFPHIMVFLFDRYGFFKGLLFLGVAMYGCCVSGLLYRPPRRQIPMKRSRLTTVSGSNACDRESCATDDDGTNESCSSGGDLSSIGNTDHISQPDGSIDKSTYTEVVSKVTRFRSAAIIINRWLDVAVWKDWRFSMFAVSQALSVMCLVPVWMLLPAVAEDNGMSVEESASVLSAIAGGDIVGRFLSGFVFDMPLVRRHRYRPFSAVMMLLGFLILSWPFVTSFLAMCLSAVTFGLFLGIVVAQRTTILRDLLGMERFSSALGMMVFAQGVGVFVGPFLAGEYANMRLCLCNVGSVFYVQCG